MKKNKGYRIIKGDNHLISLHKELIDLCKRHRAILNLATSDVVMYIENGSKNLIKIIKIKYPDMNIRREKHSWASNVYCLW